MGSDKDDDGDGDGDGDGNGHDNKRRAVHTDGGMDGRTYICTYG